MSSATIAHIDQGEKDFRKCSVTAQTQMPRKHKSHKRQGKCVHLFANKQNAGNATEHVNSANLSISSGFAAFHPSRHAHPVALALLVHSHSLSLSDNGQRSTCKRSSEAPIARTRRSAVCNGQSLQCDCSGSPIGAKRTKRRVGKSRGLGLAQSYFSCQTAKGIQWQRVGEDRRLPLKRGRNAKLSLPKRRSVGDMEERKQTLTSIPLL